MKESEPGQVGYWIAYEGGLSAEAERLARRLHDELGIDALPMRLG